MHRMSDQSVSHNTHLSFYPHLQEEWERRGIFVSLNPYTYPRLFNLSGHTMISWKEGINGECA